MNKNPEKFAIEYLIRNGFKLEEDYNNFARQVVKIAIEALEKQIPKKVGETFGDYENSYYCDRCGRNLRYEHQKYCEDCGGKQSW